MIRSSLVTHSDYLDHMQTSKWCLSKMGYKFDRSSDLWQIDGSTRIHLSRIRELDAKTEEGLRKSICRYAEELSAHTTANALTMFYRYCDYIAEKHVSVTGLTKWRTTLSDETEWWLGTLKGFLIAWHEWGYPGINVDVVNYLENLTLKGNMKGKAVRNGCPYSGPLTQIELGALLEWASNAYLKRSIELNQYAYFLTLAFTGRRSTQIRALRACDLITKKNASGHEYFVNFPRAKQRGIGYRKSFNALTVNEDIYMVLQKQAEDSQITIERILGKNLTLEIRNQIPVFLADSRAKSIRDLNHLMECLKVTPDYLHMTDSRAMGLLKAVSIKNIARSERTGDFINFTSRRFRYTTGTNLARRGITGVALAVALDHSDTQNIDVYTENTEEMAEQIDNIMAPVLAPLAQAFTGVLIDSERDAVRANDPHSRIKNDKAHSIGNCGTHSFCASGYRACYTCVNFQPWRDAPHEEVLEKLLSERKLQLELGVSPYVIQSTDRLLLAVQQVILMCKDFKFLKLNTMKHG